MRRLMPLLVLAAAAGCGTTIAGSPGPQADTVPSAAAAAPPADGASGDGAPVDACSMIPAAEVEKLIGSNGGPKGTSTSGRSDCMWENSDTYHSVTIDIGAPGTAANGLPAWDPALGPEQVLPDGMREINGGVQFAAAGRDCLVQIVTDPASKEDVDRSVALAKSVQGQL